MTPEILEQIKRDALNVAQWMDDNHAEDDSIGFATAWGEIQSIIRKVNTEIKKGQPDATTARV